MGCQQRAKQYIIVNPSQLANKFPSVKPDLMSDANRLINSINKSNGMNNNSSFPSSNMNNNSIAQDRTINTNDSQPAGENVLNLAHDFFSSLMGDVSNVGNEVSSELGATENIGLKLPDVSNSNNTVPDEATLKEEENLIGNSDNTQNNSTNNDNNSGELKNIVSSLLSKSRRSKLDLILGILLIVGGLILAVKASKRDRAYVAMIIATIAIIFGAQMIYKFAKRKEKTAQ